MITRPGRTRSETFELRISRFRNRMLVNRYILWSHGQLAKGIVGDLVAHDQRGSCNVKFHHYHAFALLFLRIRSDLSNVGFVLFTAPNICILMFVKKVQFIAKRYVPSWTRFRRNTYSS